jgi:5-methylcytosine-specific restriction endonuclease McrA
MATAAKFRKKMAGTPVRRCKGRKWRRTRDEFFALDPLNRLCRNCLKSGRTRATKIVDHIIPVNRRPDLEFDLTNLQGLCQDCSDLKTAAENRGDR